MKPTKQNKTAALLIGAIVITLSLAGAYPFVFLSMKGKIARAGDISAQAEDFESKRGTLSRTLIFLKESAGDIEKIKAVFIKESEIVSFTRALEALGAQSGTELSLESLEPLTGAGKEPVLNFRIKATGTFAQVMRLEELLENFPAKIEIGSVRSARSDAGATSLEGKRALAPSVPTWEFYVAARVLNFSKE